MKSLLRMLLGGAYGYVCYGVVLWLVATAAPRLNLGGDHLKEAILWPLNIYLYIFPGHWADVTAIESMLTIVGALMIARGMRSAGKKAWQPRPL